MNLKDDQLAIKMTTLKEQIEWVERNDDWLSESDDNIFIKFMPADKAMLKDIMTSLYKLEILEG